MINEPFTASNGIRIKADPDGIMTQPHPSMPWRYMDGYCPGTDLDTAMAEWYRHRRDVELGRWRDPEDLDVYIPHRSLGTRPGRGERRWVTVHDERLNTSVEIAEDYDRAGMGSRWDTAKRYFAAHPARQPWYDAQSGELWILTIDGEQVGALAWRPAPGPTFETATGTLRHDDPDITAGRRIWPEETDDE